MDIKFELLKAQSLIRVAYPTAELRFDEAEGDWEDDGATLFIEGKETEISIQIGEGYLCVNEWIDNRTAMYHHYQGNCWIECSNMIISILAR
jgi:hypothetical protein